MREREEEEEVRRNADRAENRPELRGVTLPPTDRAAAARLTSRSAPAGAPTAGIRSANLIGCRAVCDSRARMLA